MIPFSSFSERLYVSVRMSVAYMLMTGLFVINIVSLSAPLEIATKIPVFLMCIYYWSVYRPTLIPLWLVFIAGIVMDLLSAMPIGISALIYVAARWVVTDQRRFLTGQNFIMIWIGFVVLGTFSLFLQWAILGLLNFQWLSVYPLWISSFFSAAVFPLIYIILHFSHKILPVP